MEGKPPLDQQATAPEVVDEVEVRGAAKDEQEEAMLPTAMLDHRMVAAQEEVDAEDRVKTQPRIPPKVQAHEWARQ